ncbi:MAG: A/G-specific adenine glycosylase [Leptothrix ochracea]|uniref:A/G-specific adenine glycosylase n=1 Tax=Leptothrix ochracea TaxID=735331 RepID=UPI0034E1FFEE
MLTTLLATRARALAPLFARDLVVWQRHQGRHDLPWQRDRDPYRVWLSEIMLQQTQVSTVLGYFERFLHRFPDVHGLAAASLDEVLAQWAGLGYYRRARFLHQCAQAVVRDHGGVFPRQAAQLVTLPGIGPSTAAAIASFCFEERVSIMDGNVRRVLSRLLACEADPATTATQRALETAAAVLLPLHADVMPTYTQGLMDLGATLCTPRDPACGRCPMAASCHGLQSGEPQRYPAKGRRLVRQRRENWWLWAQCGDQIWLEQRPDQGVWAGLWTLPLLDSAAACQEHLGGGSMQALPVIQHALTHFDWFLHPVKGSIATASPRFRSQGRWVPFTALAGLALPAPLQKLLKSINP